MDDAIIFYIKKEYNLMIGERTAEEIKIRAGCPPNEDTEDHSIDVRGRDLITGLPKTIPISSSEVREALKEPVNQIVEAIKLTLERTHRSFAADIMDKGIMLTVAELFSMELTH